MAKAAESINGATLAELEAVVLTEAVKLLDPGVVVTSRGLGYVVLEAHNVRVGDLFGASRGKDRSSAIVDGLCAEPRGSSSGGRGQAEDSEEASHDGRSAGESTGDSVDDGDVENNGADAKDRKTTMDDG